MKNKFFFKDERNNPVMIQEFDYEYVRNSLLKVFDRSVSKKYVFNVIVSRDYDASGMPNFDVRPLDLNEIYYETTSLRALEMMLDDIYFGRVSIKDLPVPKLQQEYQEFLEGRAKPVAIVQNASIPAPVEYVRKELDENDPRLPAIMEQPANYPIDGMKVLDWIENFELCSQEMTVSTQNLSVEQLKLVQTLKDNGEHIQGIMNNLTTVLETMFPLKPTFTQRLFGKKDIVVKKEDLNSILNTLTNAVKIDTHRFSGINEVFKRIQANISEIKENVEMGIVGCNFAIQKFGDDQQVYEFELRHERLLKIRATTDISEMSLTTANRNFLSSLNNLKEMQDVMIPLLVVKLQNQATPKVDDETVSIIRNLAYRDEAPIVQAAQSESDEADSDKVDVSGTTDSTGPK